MLYALVLRLLLPAAWWGRLRVDGAEAICVFPEGRLSGGERLRARSGVARLAS